MQRLRTYITVFSIVGLLLAGASWAQQREGAPERRPDTSLPRPEAQAPAAPKVSKPEEPPIPKASTFIGSSVTNAQGESLGKIEDLVIDPAEGRIKYAALSYGSILGLGGKLFAVSWDALRLQPDGKSFVLDVPKETLDTASGFDKAMWPERPDPTLSASAGEAGKGTGQSQGTRPDEAVSAVVGQVNVEEQTITLRMERGETLELQAPAEMLVGLQSGDVVQVKRSGKQATEIQKQHQTPQPNIGGTPQPQQNQSQDTEGTKKY